MAARVVTVLKETMVAATALRRAEITAASMVTRADPATILMATIRRAAMARKADKAVTARDAATRADTAHKEVCRAVVLTTKKWVPEEVLRAATAAVLRTTTSLLTKADRRAVPAEVLRAAATTTMTTVHLLPVADATTTMIINRYKF